MIVANLKPQVAGMAGKQTIVINKPGGGQMTAGGQQVGQTVSKCDF